MNPACGMNEVSSTNTLILTGQDMYNGLARGRGWGEAKYKWWIIVVETVKKKSERGITSLV